MTRCTHWVADNSMFRGGRRCRLEAVEGSLYCQVHRPETVQARREAAVRRYTEKFVGNRFALEIEQARHAIVRAAIDLCETPAENVTTVTRHRITLDAAVRTYQSLTRKAYRDESAAPAEGHDRGSVQERPEDGGQSA